MADLPFNTGNPVPSADPKDRWDNSLGLEHALLDKTPWWLDRKGLMRRTWHWIETAATGIPAIEAAVRAEQAAETAGLLAGFYKDVAEGLTKTVAGQFFSTPSTSLFEFMNQYEHMADGSAKFVKSYPSSTAVSDAYERTKDVRRSLSGQLEFAVADQAGNAALSVDNNGITDAQDLRLNGVRTAPGEGDSFWDFAIHDKAGNVIIGVDRNNVPWMGGKQLAEAAAGVEAETWKTVEIGTDSAIVLISDSTGAAHYVTKDKAYISQLSQLSPYRHINFSVSGNDLLDMQYRAINDIATTGATLKAMGAKYAFITSWLNDRPFLNVNREMYAENMRRLIDTVRGLGITPVLTSEFPTISIEFALIKRIAKEAGCEFIDCSSLNQECGVVKTGPFMQGTSTQHPGNRSGGTMWLPMHDFIRNRMPVPERAVKVFRRRAGVTGPASDMLYSNVIGKAKKWKEISVFHFSLTQVEKVDELSQLNYNGETFTYDANQDEYLRIKSGAGAAFTGMALVEVTLPGGPATLDAIEVTIGTSSPAAVSVRNMLDVPASMPGKNQGSTPTDPTYLSKWDRPRGAWRSIGSSGDAILIEKDALAISMNGNTVQILVEAASFSINKIKVRYKGGDSVKPPAREPAKTVIGANLLEEPLCGTDAQRAKWRLDNPLPIVVPIDVESAPRKPGTSTPVDGVTVITSTSTMWGSIPVPLVSREPRKYRVEVWCRYYPKAFLRPEIYPGLDASQIVDRTANPNGATVTADTLDIRTIKCEFWGSSGYPAAGGSAMTDFAAMQWHAVYFDYDALPYATNDTLNFKLSCPDGEIQVAKAEIYEVK